MVDHSPAALVGKNLSGHDLRHADLTRKILFGVDLRNAKLTGASITLDCPTFDGVMLDDRQVAMMLMLVSQANIDQRWQDGLRDLVKVVNGDEAYEAMNRYLKLT